MPSEDEPAATGEEVISGVRGWLLVYVVGPGILGTLFSVATAQILWSVLPSSDQAFLVFEVIANIVGMALIFTLRQPLTRWFHVALNGIVAAYVVNGPLDPETIALFMAALVWGTYWLRSERVQNTFGGRRIP